MSTTYVDGTTPLDAAHMNALQQKIEKGAINGYAGLDATGKVPTGQLPTIPAALPPVVNGQWLKGVSSNPAWASIVAADITNPTNGQWLKGSGGSTVWSAIQASDITASTNGQWLKGTGGAAVWAAITQPDLPANLNYNAMAPPGNDWNQVLASGWYNASGASNSPASAGGAWIFVLHFTHVNTSYNGSPAWATQIAWTMQSDPVSQWTRSKLNGTWTAWTLVGSGGSTGGKRIEAGQYGGTFIPAQGAADQAITFSSAFSSQPAVIACDMLNGQTGWAAGGGYVKSISTTGFVYTLIQGPNADVSNSAFDWIAIGN